MCQACATTRYQLPCPRLEWVSKDSSGQRTSIGLLECVKSMLTHTNNGVDVTLSAVLDPPYLIERGRQWAARQTDMFSLCCHTLPTALTCLALPVLPNLGQ